MNNTDLGLPRQRDARPTLICMNCGEAGMATANKTASSDGKQSWCNKCSADRKAAIARRMDAKEYRAVEDRERGQVLALMHERGREHDPEHCPLCARP